MKTITVAITGASGIAYSLRLMELLLQAGHRVYLVYSSAAQFVAAQECGVTLSPKVAETRQMLLNRYACKPEQLQVLHVRTGWPHGLSTGATDAMVVCPCTMGALAAIACGMSDNLIERAADVMLKEQKKLILVPRETPFSAIHLENMLKLARLGAVILAPNPGFYHLPASIEDIVDFVVAKILDQLQVEHQLMARWGEAG